MLFNSTSYLLMGIALVGAIVGITVAYIKYIKKSELPSEDENITGISKIIYNDFVDFVILSLHLID